MIISIMRIIRLALCFIGGAFCFLRITINITRVCYRIEKFNKVQQYRSYFYAALLRKGAKEYARFNRNKGVEDNS